MIARAARRPDWGLGLRDEWRWSRPAQPDLFAWAAGGPLRLTPPTRAEGDGPAALACYGVLRPDAGGVMPRFAGGRPVSPVTEDFPGGVCDTPAAEGKTVFARVGDNAAWPVSKRVGRWTARHNRRVRPAGGCRTRVCGRPIQAPWLTPIAPGWMHGERAIVEADREPTAAEVRERVFAHFGTEPTKPLKQAVG